MDERREEREELAALDREVEDLRREQEAEERFWNGDTDAPRTEPFPSEQGRGSADAANKGKVKRRLKHELKQGKRKRHVNKRGRYVKKRQSS